MNEEAEPVEVPSEVLEKPTGIPMQHQFAITLLCACASFVTGKLITQGYTKLFLDDAGTSVIDTTSTETTE